MGGKTVHFWMRYCSFFVHILGLLVSVAAYSQFGNEWINFNQSYYKIPVAKRGIYRLTYTDLIDAGVPVNSVDPRRIQILRRGVEQSIRFQSLQTPANSAFEPGEYLEFYGDKNDGETDVDLYKNPVHHPHPYINLYSDTAAYFLTWNLLAVQGKRMAEPNPEINVGGLPAESGFINTNLQVYYDQYSAGLTYAGLNQSSLFDEGEGWTGPVICTLSSGCNGQQDFTLSIPKGVTSLSPPQLEVLLVGRAEVGHAFEIYAGPNASSLRLVASSTFINFQTFKSISSLQWTDVGGDGSIIVRVKGLGVGGVRESLSVSYIKIDYLKSFDFVGVTSQELQLQANAGNKSYIEIQNAPVGLRLFDVTDQTASVVIGTYIKDSNLAAVVSNTNSSRKIFATSELITPTIKKVTFRLINPTANNYIIISHESLRKPTLRYSDPVKAYGAFRASPAGGSYDTVVVNSSLLFDQFNYGETSARAIYQFLKYMNSGGNTQYLFLMGKGLELNFAYDRKRIFLPTDLRDLVPTGGYPGSDLVFSVGLNGTTFEPSIPTGRLTANTSTDVEAYLDKIKEAEALQFDNLWRKNILHLSGGINPGEPAAFKTYVNGFKTIAEDVYMGAHVETKSKKTLQLETVPIADQVNAGLSLITFFGHSTTNVLDFEIGFVTNPVFGYNNPGKYPSFLINGCNVGRIYDNRTGTQRSFGEDWILAPNKGAKSFIAHSSFGFETLLRKYSDLFYQNVFGDSIGITQGVGDIQIEVCKNLMELAGPTTFNLSMMQQMVLMGDPAVPVFGASKPDYAIAPESLMAVSTDGLPITVATGTFGIQYKVWNFGQARNDSLKVTLQRTFPDNSVAEYDTLVSPVYYEKDFVFLVPKTLTAGGQNSFSLKIDPANEHSELKETNNEATLDFYVPSSATFNLVPFPNSTVHETEVELIFQNTNHYPEFRNYQLELDTVPDFSSSFLMQKQIVANVLARIKTPIVAKDSTVYYWRTRLDEPREGESNEWFTTSFAFLATSGEGWSQLRTNQLSENEFVSMELNESTGKFSFPAFVSDVFVQNFGSDNPTPYTNTSFKVNNEELNVGTQLCRLNTINIVAFDKTTGNPYAPIPFSFADLRTCGKDPQVINDFTLAQAAAAINGLAQAITNIGVSDSIVIFTIGDAGVQSYSADLISKLGEVGVSSSQLSGFQPGEPMIVFGRKGSAPGTAKVIRPGAEPVVALELVANETITARPVMGSIRTGKIGPAKSWSGLYHNVSEVEPSDTYVINVIGVGSGDAEQLLYSGNENPINLSFVDPTSYPTLKIELQATDPVNLTPVALKNWTIQYTPVAEGILLLRNNLAEPPVQEGLAWNGKLSFVNLTPRDFMFADQGDSLGIELKLINPESGVVHSKTKNYKSPWPLDSVVIDWPVETIGKVGIHNLEVTMNTLNVPEQYVFNNHFVMEGYPTVIGDRQPPVLDVTVDGRYLANGDDVSTNPTINIKIIDENIFYLKTDTAGIEIEIGNLDAGTSKRIYFNDPSLTWSPATPEIDFNIDFTVLLSPAEYELSVQGTDASGNKSGEAPYRVTFIVSDEEAIRIENPFPNPSNSHFTFPVRISGNELPESFSLKIFGPDGRLMKQFSLPDVSGFYVGTNYVQWNAADFNGNNLPTGLYYFTMELSLPAGSHSKSGRILLVRP